MPLRLVPPIHRATHRIGLYLTALGDEGLSQGEAHILALLAESGPSTIAALHAGLAHKRSTLTSILDRLAGRGLITREVGESDRRTFVVTPTAEGARTAERVREHLQKLERAVRQAVPARDLDAFQRVVAAVEDHAHALTASPSPSRPARTGPRSRPSPRPRRSR